MPLPKRQFLDPRPLAEALAEPIVGAVNIPWEELPLRAHELPPPRETVRIVASPTLSRIVGDWLEKGGRVWESVPFERTDAYTSGRLWSPHPLVESFATSQAPGIAWDLGCGSGRDAIYLASCGWKVIAIDHLADAVERGQLSATRLLEEGAKLIEWRAESVSARAIPEGNVDLALMIFFLKRDALARTAQRLAPGGSILLETYTPTHRLQTGKPKDATLAMDARGARELLEEFEFLLCDEALRGERHTLRVQARKPSRPPESNEGPGTRQTR